MSADDTRTEDRKFNFTEDRVGAAAHAGTNPAISYTLFWDTGQPGLGLRVGASGVRRFIFERRLKTGATCRVTIGDPATRSLKEARARARKLGVLVDDGGDPRIVAKEKAAKDKAARVEVERQAHVMRGVWAAYIDAHRDAWGERHLEDHESLAHPGGVKRKRGKGLTVPGPLASLMTFKLSEITSETVAAWLKREGKRRPTSAAGAYRLLRAFCAWTQEKPEAGQPDYRGIVAADACTAGEVVKVLPVSKPKKDDCLQRGDLPAWFAAVRARALSNPVIAAYLQALLLTGSRREELARLRWDDVKMAADPQWSSLSLRDKVEGRRTISLTPYVASLIKALPRRNDWVFSSLTAKGGRLMEPTRAHADALEAAGIKHVSLHGLRRSFATLPEYLDEMPVGIVAQIMGHKPSATAEKHYKDRPLDLLHKWHSKLEAWILAEAGVAFVPSGDKAKLGVVKADGTVQPAA